ncbi:MAG TPA: apolipoprotein N-acyltransferase [Terracidiphilus sp.]|nr:apolipoprotein N-acyltransferase [Terracidiphilus sp.]
MDRGGWKLWAATGLSAGLLELPFPLAGPMPPWRSVFAWFGLVPLLWAVLSAHTREAPRPLRRAFQLSYLCGVLWYCGNCYWIRDTMMHYGDMPTGAPTLLLIGFSLVLGLYFGLFGLALALVQRATGNGRLALAAAPVVWTALELAASRITSVPWDQLGYSQVDNLAVNQLAPWTGVYGISFVLVAVNALLAGGMLAGTERLGTTAGTQGLGGAGGLVAGIAGVLLAAGGMAGLLMQPPRAAGTATAVLIQPNLDVGSEDTWPGMEWGQHMADFTRLAGEECKTYIAGIPQTGAANGEIVCPPYPTHPDLVAWPESPAPYAEADPRFEQGMAAIARTVQAPMVVGSVGMEYAEEEHAWHDFNSALVFGSDGTRDGRYDKIHLVPFGEYIPFKDVLVFAHKLTGRVAEFTRGRERKVFHLNGHRYGVFICYEAVFADEVREFPRLGAEVLVNLSDDGWYGDTSAPWQHLNMARMRAIENRRWILRDTNSGVTAAIDPDGRVRQSIPRHAVDALPAQYGFRDDITFYTAHGDVFAWACAILGLGVVGWAYLASLPRTSQIKVRS